MEIEACNSVEPTAGWVAIISSFASVLKSRALSGLPCPRLPSPLAE